MKLFNYTKPAMIVAEEGKHIRKVDDVYVPEHIDPETGEVIPEHFPYYATVIFVPSDYTEEKMNEDYVEEDIETSNDEPPEPPENDEDFKSEEN